VKRDPVRAALDALAAAARRPHEPDATARIRTSLGHRSNHVVARAARAAREADLAALAPDVMAAFPRFLTDAVRRDPGCVAKTDIVRALLAFAHPAADVYLVGARHVQREPAFGPPIDTAAELRATSGLALVATAHPDALAVCVALLVDPAPMTRGGALRALGMSGRPDVALALRLFVLRGDDDPDVLAEAFAALLALAPAESVGFVADGLRSAREDTARAAALALGDSRRREAVDALRARLSAEDRPDVRRALMLGLASSRDDDAITALLELIAQGTHADSRTAHDALRIYAHDEALQRRVASASRRRARRKK
jgi:HEAT repeat protein